MTIAEPNALRIMTFLITYVIKSTSIRDVANQINERIGEYMEIIANNRANNREHIAFKDLKKGDIFVLASDGKLYIKSDDFYAVRLSDGEKRMYYMSAYSNDISVYVEITKDDKIKADEESAKRESERQTLKELRERGNEIDDRCEALREGFMLDANFNDSDSKRNLIAYIMYAMSANSGYDDAALLKIAGLKYDEGECINLDDCLADTGKTLMAMAYAFFSGFHDSSYIDFSYYEGVTRNINPELNRFYNLLCKLGYVMSDEEIQLRDGTHPIFTSGEVK